MRDASDTTTDVTDESVRRRPKGYWVGGADASLPTTYGAELGTGIVRKINSVWICFMITGADPSTVLS